MSAFRKTLKKYIPEFILDSMMCHGDPFWVERKIVAYIDKEDIEKIWRYISSFVQEQGELPSYSQDTIKSVASSENISLNTVDRWLTYCYAEIRRLDDQARAPPFRFVD